MKIKYHCSACFSEAGSDPAHLLSLYKSTSVIEIDTWPFFEVECNQGHKQRFTIGLELYALLFQQATYCIMDGYYREAIGTYNAALERFFEYAIEVIAMKQYPQMNFEEFWKTVRNQSERQLGIFYFVWSSYFNEKPILLQNKKVELRNNVIHKGILATKNDAMEFGEYIFDYIKKVNKQISENLGAELSIFESRRIYRVAKSDFDHAIENPIEIKINGEIHCNGIGGMHMPYFLNSDNIANYKDCFEPDNDLSYGLLK